ncbi:Translocation and assembly module TamA precursor [Labrenzia sp. THAF82]|uniref:autotransporter assembly complex protein TamA n=1 Tax=Labrenzia sp. THAF82 TaxID=2587861 RepID=UPI0012A965DA|nr:autotransporter assembly complex family protein [Labrenzia sp. THAF82]QFT32524.1 Translocation and assembly module TamA precursor [Labrenzia sp. THAF82]
MKGLPSCMSGSRADTRLNVHTALAALQVAGARCIEKHGLIRIILVGALLAVPLPAHSFEVFGWKFFESAEDEAAAVPDPLPYKADLSISSGGDHLKDELEGASLLVQQQDKPPSGEAGLIARALSDRERLIAKLYADGRYGGTVDITLSGIPLETALEQSDLPDARPVNVSIVANPGPVFTFGKVVVVSRGGDLTSDPGYWGLKAGDVAASGKILTAEKRMVADLRGRGFPKASIAERRITADHSTDTLDVTLVADAGEQARFGKVSVSGTEVTDPDFVVQQAMLPEGKIYSPEDLARARKRLNELGIFSSIRLVEGHIEGPDGNLPITIEVSERKRHVIGAGASWSSTEGFGVESYWRRRNLFGRGELLSVEGSIGRIGTESIEDQEYSARIAFEKPGVFGPLTSFSTSLEARQENPDAYKSRTITFDAYLNREFSDTLKGRAGAEIFYANEEDAFGDDDYLLFGLPADLTFDNRDDKLNPSKGVFAAVFAEPAYDTLNSNAMGFVKGTVSSYYALDEAKRFILAGRVSAGSIVAPSVEAVPASRRFIAGGGGSIRGYAYRNVGPRINDEVTGGRSLLELSGEVRVKITDTIGVVGFVDAGNAYEDSIPDFSESLKVGVGAGLRYFTPIGPLRIDAAVPLDPGPGDPDFALYVGLSQAF